MASSHWEDDFGYKISGKLGREKGHGGKSSQQDRGALCSSLPDSWAAEPGCVLETLSWNKKWSLGAMVN